MNKKIAVSTRFHSWAENDFSAALDLNKLIIQHPAATFFMRVKGTHMQDAGIYQNDIVVVDRALSLSNHKLIIARLDGQLMLRRVLITGGTIALMPAGSDDEPLIINAERDFEVWGVVTYIIRQA